jgi:hypothetical protein
MVGIMAAGLHCLEIELLKVGVAQFGSSERVRQLAVTHDADGRGDFLRAEQIVGRHQHCRAAFGVAAQQHAELVRRARIKAARGLVQEQGLGVLGKCDRDANLLPHALRVAGYAAILRVLLQSGFGQESALLGVTVAGAGERAEIGKVFDAREMTIEIDLLWNVGKQALGFERVHGHVEAVHGRAPAVRCYEPEKAIDCSGLTGAVGTEECEDFSASDRERKIVDGGHAVESLSEVFGVQHG